MKIRIKKEPARSSSQFASIWDAVRTIRFVSRCPRMSEQFSQLFDIVGKKETPQYEARF
jgi:hypothetical protein